MAAILWSDVQALPNAPAKLAAVDPLMQTVMLTMANTFLDVTLTGGEDAAATKLVRCLYVAHLFTMGFAAGASAASGAIGPVSKDQAGKILTEYGSLDRTGGGMNSDPLSLTLYGRLVLTLVWPTTRMRVL
jgi:hypothetical protein